MSAGGPRPTAAPPSVTDEILQTCDVPQPAPATRLRLVGADEVYTALSVRAATEALARGFAVRTREEVDGIPRMVVGVPAAGRSAGGDRTQAGGGTPAVDATQTRDGTPAVDGAQGVGRTQAEDEVLLMPASGPEGAGVKLLSIAAGNPARGLPLIQGAYLLFSTDGLTPELLIDAAALTRLRTTAVTSLATRHLARADSRRLVVFGAGTQAAAHVDAMRAMLPIDHMTIVGREPGSPSAARLVGRLRDAGVDADVGGPEAVAEADVICTCTTSRTALFDDRDLKPGVHINAIGAYRHDMAEVPAASFGRALLVVESEEATLAEAGDVVAAISAGALPPTGFAHELNALARGEVRRTDADQLTIFKSVGISVEDLIVARALADALAGER